MYINTLDDKKKQILDCSELSIKEDYFFNNSIIFQIYFKEKIYLNKKEELYYLNNEFTLFIINIFLLKLIKIKSLKNFNLLIENLNSTLEEVNNLVIFLNSEILFINNNYTYKSEFFLKLNLTINSLFFLIFINNQSDVKDFLELNIFSTFAIKNLNFFLKNIVKELAIDKKNNYKLWYIICNIIKISRSLNIGLEASNYCNIFFQFFFEEKSIEKLENTLNIYVSNVNLIVNGTQKYLRKLKSKVESSEDEVEEEDIDELYKNNTIDPIKLEAFLTIFFSKKYNIFLRNKCSQQLSFLNDTSFFLIKINLFYKSKLIVEFGYKYWSNSSLNLTFLKKNIYDKILLNKKKLDLEVDFKENLLINHFFKNKKFYIKKNNYNNFNSIFDFEKIKIINNKLQKSVYYTDTVVFLELFNFFENFLKNINFKENIKKLKECILYFEENIEKINNFNFFNIEVIPYKEQEKYKIFFDIFNIYVWTYKNYINNVILNSNFLNYFYKNVDIEELINCIKKEQEYLDKLLSCNLNFETLNYLIKTIKNLILFLNDTLEINIKDVSNNNYDSSYFIKIEYCEYIIFLNKLKILIAYLEQIITVFNLKQKIIENKLNKNKMFGIEIKLDFRGRLYSIDIVKAYDNNKLLRQSIKIKNTIKISSLLNWYLDLYKKLNINMQYFLEKSTYKFILEQKEFKELKYIFKLNLFKINKKDFLKFLYLKSKIAIISYIGFLILSSEEKKTYSILDVLKNGYFFYIKNNASLNNFKKDFFSLKLDITIENYLELIQSIDSLNLLNKKESFNELLSNNKLLSLDSSCNGYTHLLYTFSELNEEKFNQFKKVLNLSNDEQNYDFYSEVLTEIKKSNSFLKEQIENKIINRNSIKKIVMTIPYNAKEYSFYEKLKNEIEEKDKNKKEKIIKDLISFFSKNFKDKIINKTFIIKLKSFLKNNKIKNLWYIIDENTKINISYFKEKNEKIPFIDNVLNKKKSIYIKVLTSELNIEKTITASIANIIHANDAFVIKELIINSKLNILTIHDCVKFDSFLYEEIIFLYEYIFKNFYKNYNIYDKIYYETEDSNELKKVFNEVKNKNTENIVVFEKSQYILKL